MTQPCAMCRSGVMTPNAADIYIGRLVSFEIEFFTAKVLKKPLNVRIQFSLLMQFHFQFDGMDVSDSVAVAAGGNGHEDSANNGAVSAKYKTQGTYLTQFDQYRPPQFLDYAGHIQAASFSKIFLLDRGLY